MFTAIPIARTMTTVAEKDRDRLSENPMLPMIATCLNTLAAHGVPADHRHLVIMFHQRTPDIDIVMSNAAYKERYNRDNPNVALIHALKQAGVDIACAVRACSAGRLRRTR